MISLVFADAETVVLDHYYPVGYSARRDHPSTRAYPTHDDNTVMEFDDRMIDVSIRDRINEWISDILVATAYDPSQILLAKFCEMIDSSVLLTAADAKHDQKRAAIIAFVGSVLTFFLAILQLRMSPERASAYASFILTEVRREADRVYDPKFLAGE